MESTRKGYADSNRRQQNFRKNGYRDHDEEFGYWVAPAHDSSSDIEIGEWWLSRQRTTDIKCIEKRHALVGGRSRAIQFNIYYVQRCEAIANWKNVTSDSFQIKSPLTLVISDERKHYSQWRYLSPNDKRTSMHCLNENINTEKDQHILAKHIQPAASPHFLTKKTEFECEDEDSLTLTNQEIEDECGSVSQCMETACRFSNRNNESKTPTLWTDLESRHSSGSLASQEKNKTQELFSKSGHFSPFLPKITMIRSDQNSARLKFIEKVESVSSNEDMIVQKSSGHRSHSRYQQGCQSLNCETEASEVPTFCISHDDDRIQLVYTPRDKTENDIPDTPQWSPFSDNFSQMINLHTHHVNIDTYPRRYVSNNQKQGADVSRPSRPMTYDLVSAGKERLTRAITRLNSSKVQVVVREPSAIPVYNKLPIYYRTQRIEPFMEQRMIRDGRKVEIRDILFAVDANSRRMHSSDKGRRVIKPTHYI